MDLTPRSIQEKQFHDQWRGYNQAEVDDFLDRVAETLDRVQRENEDLRDRIRELDQAMAASRDTEEMLKKTLVTAQRAAEEAIAKAKTKAEELVAEAEARVHQTETAARERISTADEESRRKRSEAETEARRKLTEAEETAKRMVADVERDSSARRRQLDEHIQKLQTFESDIKRRLRTFLDQQTNALDALTETPAPQLSRPVAQTSSFQSGIGAARPQARPSGAAQHSESFRPSWEQRPKETEEEPQSHEYADEARPEGDEAEPQESTGVFEVPDQGDEEEDESGHRRGVRDLFFRHQG
jgi:cell division initiation protein